MAWVILGATTLTETANSINVTGLEAKDYLTVQVYTIASGENTVRCRFNNDSTGNYASRYEQSAGGDSTAINQTEMWIGQNNGQASFTSFYVRNKATLEKLVISNSLEQNSAGAGSAPAFTQAVALWDNNSDSINEINIIDTQSGQYDVGSQCIVWGTD